MSGISNHEFFREMLAEAGVRGDTIQGSRVPVKPATDFPYSFFYNRIIPKNTKPLSKNSEGELTIPILHRKLP